MDRRAIELAVDRLAESELAELLRLSERAVEQSGKYRDDGALLDVLKSVRLTTAFKTLAVMLNRTWRAASQAAGVMEQTASVSELAYLREKLAAARLSRAAAVAPGTPERSHGEVPSTIEEVHANVSEPSFGRPPVEEVMEDGSDGAHVRTAREAIHGGDRGVREPMGIATHEPCNDYAKIFELQLGVPPGAFTECYAFSIHKAGSTLMHKMIAQACQRARIPAISIPDVLFREGIFERDWGNDRGILTLIGPGRIYYGFRSLPEILLDESVRLKSRKSVLLVRDPRDALVSQYFSFGGKHISHKLPEKNPEAILDKAKRTEHMEIDEYVLALAPHYLKRLTDYKSNLDFGNVLLRRYEDIYFDKRKFLGEIFDHFGVAVDPAVLDTVAEMNDVRPEAEDVTQHIRKGTPGDYAEKLDPGTIEELNKLFSPICKWYGYELN